MWQLLNNLPTLYTIRAPGLLNSNCCAQVTAPPSRPPTPRRTKANLTACTEMCLGELDQAAIWSIRTKGSNGRVHFSTTFDSLGAFTTVLTESALSTEGSCPKCEEETRNADLSDITAFSLCSRYAL